MGIATTGNGPPRSSRIQIMCAAVCAAALGVALTAVAVGTWRSAAPSARVDSPAPASTDQGRAGQGTMPGDVPAAAGAPAVERVTVYLVSSAADADALERDVHAFLGRHEDVVGDGGTIALAAGTADEWARVRVVVRDLRVQLGDDRVRVVDLRSRAADEPVAPTVE